MEKRTVKTGGSLKISDEVIIKIAELAAAEITGVATDGQGLATAELTKINQLDRLGRLISPVKVRLSSEAAEIDVSLVVKQGHKAVSVAEAVQSSVKSAVQNMAGITVSKVNVMIIGIQIDAEE